MHTHMYLHVHGVDMGYEVQYTCIPTCINMDMKYTCIHLLYMDMKYICIPYIQVYVHVQRSKRLDFTTNRLWQRCTERTTIDTVP